MTHYRWIHLDETDSTNGWLHVHGGNDDVVVWADYQTAGRGCGTNSWESERGQNLLFSVLCHPAGVPAQRQFLLLEAMSLALKSVLDAYSPGQPLTVKWPNDLYWCDRKLAGTLSECVLSGQHIRSCILGTGLNLNQTTFHSDAPNPVSVLQFSGNKLEPAATLRRIIAAFDANMQAIADGRCDELHEAYCAALYRCEGYHLYSDAHGRFSARLLTVEPDGHLLLCDTEGHCRRYAFKEVQYIIES